MIDKVGKLKLRRVWVDVCKDISINRILTEEQIKKSLLGICA